jgi:hypothetical protein
MSLPSKFVREIHSRLQVRYGSGWTTKWAGLDQAAIEADWANELDGMSPESIRKALASLPAEFPPTAGAFRALGALRHEAAAPLALPEPSNPAVAAQALGAMHTVGKPTPGEWMAKLDRDVRSGNASRSRIEHHRIATANGHFASAVAITAGDFTPINAATLPPDMQPKAQIVAHEYESEVF